MLGELRIKPFQQTGYFVGNFAEPNIVPFQHESQMKCACSRNRDRIQEVLLEPESLPKKAFTTVAFYGIPHPAPGDESGPETRGLPLVHAIPQVGIPAGDAGTVLKNKFKRIFAPKYAPSG